MIDVGITSSRSGFADSAFKLSSELVQRKLYSQANDQIGILVLGSKGTDNPFGYSNITISRYVEPILMRNALTDFCDKSCSYYVAGSMKEICHPQILMPWPILKSTSRLKSLTTKLIGFMELKQLLNT